MKRPAVFFDRDNTLIACDDYLGDASKVELVGGAADAVARARELGYATVIFSNQSGVARGYFSEDAVHAINRRLDDLLQDANPRAVIDRHDFCPYHPDASIEKYRQDSPMRKPGPGMILAAADALALDLERSWVVGDAPRDIEAGHAAGCRTILFSHPLLKSSPAALAEQKVHPDYVCSTLAEAMDFIERNTERSGDDGGGADAADDDADDATSTQAGADEQEAPSAPSSASSSAASSMDASPDPDAPPAPAPMTLTPPSASSENMDLVADKSAELPPISLANRPAAGAAAASSTTSSSNAAAATPARSTRDPEASRGEAPSAASSGKTESLLLEILHELRRRREQPDQDFSVSKLLGGITQVIVLFVLFLALLNRGDEKLLSPLLLFALTVQAMTIALLIMGKQR